MADGIPPPWPTPSKPSIPPFECIVGCETPELIMVLIPPLPPPPTLLLLLALVIPNEDVAIAGEAEEEESLLA